MKQPKTSEIQLHVCLICEMKCIPLCLETTTSVPMADGLATSLKVTRSFMEWASGTCRSTRIN